MGNTDSYYGDGEINSINGCGIDDTDVSFYERKRHVQPTQEDQDELEGILDSGEL